MLAVVIPHLMVLWVLRNFQLCSVYEPFMIEVTENHLEALIFLTKQVLRGNEDILECDVGSSSSRRVRSFDWLCLHTGTTFD